VRAIGIQDRDELRCRYTAHHCIHSCKSDLKAGTYNKHGGLRDSASLLCIQQIPFPDDAPFHVAQNGKWQRELSAQTFGLGSRIY